MTSTKTDSIEFKDMPTSERLLSVGMSKIWFDNYLAVSQGIRQHCEKIITLPHLVSEEEIIDIFNCAAIDSNFYTALSYDFRLFSRKNNPESVAGIKLRFYESQEDIDRNNEEINRIANTFVDYAVNKIDSEIMRLVFFVHLLAKNVKFADEILDMKLSKESIDCIARTQSLAGVFIDKNAVCHGFARALTLLCGRAGIECYTVLGKTKDCDEFSCSLGNELPLSHAWNIVEIEGVKAHVDVTLAQKYIYNNNKGINYFPLLLDDCALDTLGYGSWFRPLPKAPKNEFTEKYAFVWAA